MPNFNQLTRTLGRKTLIFKKNSPTIFFAAGLVGVVTSTILACRSTLKLSATLDEVEKEVRAVKDMVIDDSYTEQMHKRDQVYVYVKSGAKVIRLYAPAVILGGASIAALTGSHVQLSRRNAALTAAYAVIEEAFREYRDRVRDAVGEERELDLYLGTTTETVKNELGKKEEVRALNDPSKRSVHSRIFDEFSVNWKKDPEYNKIFIQCQQNWANSQLIRKGHVFLNEVYDALGLDRSQAGSIVGWLYDPDRVDHIDFGVYDTYNTNFINGWERNALLDFNVDGIIWDKI